MSATAQKLFDGLRQLREAATPFMKEALSQTGAEISRLGTQGSMELASALFNGHGFVPYGPGQYTPTPEHGSHEHGQAQHVQPERGIER